MDLLFCNSVYLNVTDIDIIFLFDLFHPALIITFLINKSYTLNFKELYSNFKGENYYL